MANSDEIRRSVWVGVDPGGVTGRQFGVAVVVDGKPITARVSCADEAVALVTVRPDGVGVDAPLWWSSKGSSDREADRWIRKTYRIASGTVQTANSLKGAALVQGAMFVQRLREKFPGVPVTETHPKGRRDRARRLERRACRELNRRWLPAQRA